MPSYLEQSPLGQASHYPSHYSPESLHPIARDLTRAELSVRAPYGQDIWYAYELSWLDTRGKPQVAIARFTFSAAAAYLIESKSFKLYLNSLNQSVFHDHAALEQCLVQDLSRASGAAVQVELFLASQFAQLQLHELSGQSLDEQDVTLEHYQPAPQLLRCSSAEQVEECLVSHLLRSNCPVTGQPDWGSVQIRYRGPSIDHAALLAYIVSFRLHAGFHEQCVEQMYNDIKQRCQPQYLAVYARYTRRGGLDINPFRSDWPNLAPEQGRSARQ